MCKIDHTQEGALPIQLCRACRPELIPTAEQIAKREAADRAARERQNEIDKRKRELAKAQTKLDSLTRKGARWPDEGSVSFKVAQSMEKKIGRLSKELQSMAA